jgi:hypothetical protein
MGGFGAFNLDFDMDEILRLQEEEEQRQREAASAAREAQIKAAQDLIASTQAGLIQPAPTSVGTTAASAGAALPTDQSVVDWGTVDWAGLAAQPAVPPPPPPPPPLMPERFGGSWGADDFGVQQIKDAGGGDLLDQIIAAESTNFENIPGRYGALREALLGGATAEDIGTFLEGLGAPAAPPAPAASAAPPATTEPAAVEMYQQQGIVSPGISDAEQAWLDAAIAGGVFLGDPNIPGDLLGQVEIDGSSVPDPRIGMREDLAGTLLEKGHTVADIEQFLGMESLLTDEELGTVQGERIDDFAGVGSQDWFEYLAADEVYMDSPGEPGLPSPRENVESALARIEETGTATLPWVESQEFAAAYGSPGGDQGGNGGAVLTPEERCLADGNTWNGTFCVLRGTDIAVDVGGGNGGGAGGGAGDMGGAGAAGGAEGVGTGGWADPFGDQDAPPGVPVYVNEQVDAINIVRNQLKDIKDAHKRLLDSGLANIDDVEQALTDAESDIYARQYGVLGPDGELLTPGEMDRLLSTWESRRSTTKKNRASDRAEILSIMTDEGVPAGLAQSELDMIDMIHGDSVDAQYDYIDSLWRIGKMSHDERTSMIGNMMASYRLQLRDTLVEMVMAEEISAAGEIGDIRQTALQADTVAGLFENMTENQVFALMGSGMSDLLQLPEDDAIGMISDGEWAGYTSGQKANVLISAGYTENADGTFSPPAATGDDTIINTTLPNGDPFTGTADEYWAQTGEYPFAPADEEVEELTKLMPDGTTFTGTADEYYDQYGEYIFAEDEEEEEAEKTYTKTLPDGVTPFEGTPQEYFQLTGERMFAPGEDPADDLGSFRADVGVLRDMGYGDWLDGQIAAGNLTVEGAAAASVSQGKVTPASDGYVNINWADYPAEFDVPITPKEEAETTYQLPLSRFTSSAAELTGMGATVSGDTVWLSPQLATDLMALGVLKDVEEDPYDPFERFNTGLTVEDAGGVPFGAEDRDGELWMTPDGYSTFVDEMNYEEPDVPTHGVDANVTWDIAVTDMAPPTYRSDVREDLYEWNDDMDDALQYDAGTPEGRTALYADAIRRWSEKYVTEAKIVAHVTNRIVYGRTTRDRYETGNAMSSAVPRHNAEPDADARVKIDMGMNHWAAVPVANGRIAMIYASSEQAVKDAVKQAYPDKR